MYPRTIDVENKLDDIETLIENANTLSVLVSKITHDHNSTLSVPERDALATLCITIQSSYVEITAKDNTPLNHPHGRKDSKNC